QAGPVVKVKIPKDRDGRPKQFAFVNFKHEESVPYGLSLLNGIKLYGRPINIQFRAGSSHASQDGATNTPHSQSGCSRYERGPGSTGAVGFTSTQRSLPPGDNLQRQAVMNSTMRLQPPFGGKYEPPGFASSSYQHPPPPHAFHPSPAPPLSRRPEPPRKGRLNAHPYLPEGRHFGREQRFDYGRPDRGHDPEHHYRGGRDEPACEDRHRDGWSHDYDYRREGYREGKWHPSRH
ncbi:RBM7 protein, partial [Upupa epops]|nr:RBM7 protein [Upupa epops]